MKLQAFATLEAVLRRGSMTAAASEMNLTTGAVSLQIKQLETYMGQPLFDRSGRSPIPMQLAFDIADVMSKASAQLTAMRKHRSIVVSGTFRLGVIDSLQTLLLPGTFVQLKKQHPLVTLKPIRGKATELIQAVHAGEIDAAVVRQPADRGGARLAWHPLLRRELKLLAPPRSSEATLRGLMAKYDLIRLDRNTVMGELATKYLKKHVGERKNILEFDAIPTIVAMVSAGVGVALVVLPETNLDRLYPIRILRVPHAPVLQFSLVNRRADADGRLLGAVRDCLVLAAADKSEHVTLS